MERTMDDKQPYASRFAAEAVGERLEDDPTSRTAGEHAEKRPQAPVATSAGPRARMAEKTAESMGERVGDAYADATTDEARERSREAVRRTATRAGSQSRGASNDIDTFVTVLMAFGLGYIAALLIHSRG
jgi:hypothetical protein